MPSKTDQQTKNDDIQDAILFFTDYNRAKREKKVRA